MEGFKILSQVKFTEPGLKLASKLDPASDGGAADMEANFSAANEYVGLRGGGKHVLKSSSHSRLRVHLPKNVVSIGVHRRLKSFVLLRLHQRPR